MASAGQVRALYTWTTESQGRKTLLPQKYSATILNRTTTRYAFVQLVLLFNKDFKRLKDVDTTRDPHGYYTR